MSEQRGFAGADPPERWPPTRGRPRPEELDRSLDTLPGVGPSQRGKLAKLGLRTVRDLLEHRPRDYQQAVGETPISNLFGEEEAVIAGEEVTSPRLRTLVESALPHATDFGDSLPAGLRARERLPLRFDALVALHRPRDAGEAEWARRRLALDELLLLQVGLARIREGT